MNIKRSPLITIVIVLQALLGLLLAALTGYVVAQTRSPEILTDPDAPDTIRGLWIGTAVLGVPAVITLIAALGLWKRRFWGWVLALATDVGVLGVLVYNMIGENDLDRGESALAAAFVVPAVLLLLPGVREFYWNATNSQPAQKSS